MLITDVIQALQKFFCKKSCKSAIERVGLFTIRKITNTQVKLL
jgi:hypothetical protein